MHRMSARKDGSCIHFPDPPLRIWRRAQSAQRDPLAPQAQSAPRAQQVHLAWERVDVPSLRSGLECARRHLVAARGAPDPEIDASGIEHLQHAELLGDF